MTMSLWNEGELMRQVPRLTSTTSTRVTANDGVTTFELYYSTTLAPAATPTCTITTATSTALSFCHFC